MDDMDDEDDRFQVCNATNLKSTGEIMLIQKLRDILRAMFIGSLLIALLQNTFAQNQAQPAGKPAAKKSKASADSCDGALDIVPVNSMTFTRKRRSSKTQAKTEAKTEAKPEAKPEAKTGAKTEQSTPPNPADAKDAKPEKQRQKESGAGK